MKRTGAWLTVYALEQIGARFTFGKSILDDWKK